MKKRLAAIAVVLCVAFTAVPVIGASAWIGDRYDDPDTGFEIFLEEAKSMAGYDYEDVTFQKDNLYNTKGEQSGLLYEFNFDGVTDGYLMMVKLTSPEGKSVYEMTEIYFESKSPYYGHEGMKLYPTFSVFLVAQEDGMYLDVVNQLRVPVEIVQEWEEQGFGFSGTSSQWETPITINYSRKDDYEVGIESMPTYAAALEDEDNVCSVIAGSCIVGYYDKNLQNLIPNFVPIVSYGSGYTWKGKTAEINAVIAELYTGMGTNIGGDGTTIAGFQRGLQQYADSKGYSVNFLSVMQNNNYNLNLIKTYINSDYLITLFLNPYYNFTDRLGIQELQGKDWVLTTSFNGSHTMVAYRARSITYYDSSNNIFRQDEYLKVAGTLAKYSHGYIRLTDQYCSLNNAFGVKIS